MPNHFAELVAFDRLLETIGHLLLKGPGLDRPRQRTALLGGQPRQKATHAIPWRPWWTIAASKPAPAAPTTVSSAFVPDSFLCVSAMTVKPLALRGAMA